MKKIIRPPIANKKTTWQTLHGITWKDDYAWLRAHNWQDVIKNPRVLAPEIKQYLEDENHYTEAVMQSEQTLHAELFSELRARIKEDDQSVPDWDGEFAYYTRWRKDRQHPIFCRYSGTNPANEEILLDCNVEAQKFAYFENGECAHSPDHRYFAYNIDTSGSETYQLYIRDLHTGKQLDDRLDNIQSNLVWTESSRSIVYVTLDENHRPDCVRLHRLGDNPENDTLLYREPDPGFFINLGKTRSRRFIVINAHDHITSEVRLLSAIQPQSRPILVHPREIGVEYNVEERNDVLFIMTNADGRQNYKLCTTPIKTPGREHWHDFYLPVNNALLKRFFISEHFLVCLEIENALPKLLVTSLNEASETGVHRIAFDEETYHLDIVPTLDYRSPVLRFIYSSMTTPQRTYDYHMEKQTRMLVKQQEIPSGHCPEDYVTHRLTAVADDEASIPISILYKKDTPANSNSPLLLYGYGAYGYSVPAAFSPNRLSLVNRGFVYAIAHVRGGTDKGYAWYTAGKLRHKTNTFDDFIAVAKNLTDKRFCASEQIAIHGGSAGGMLIGAVLNRGNRLFRAAIADVPFVDVLNTICDDTLPLTPPEWNEWGNPITHRETFESIAAYSPYDNVQQQAYPAILVTAGVSDPRVTYWEPAKWVAKLRALKTDDNLLLLKTNLTAGHAGAAGRFDYLKEVALAYTFILKAFAENKV